MWSLWLRRNAIKYGSANSWEGMMDMTMELVRQLVKTQFPWIKKMTWSWREVIFRLTQYKPKIHVLSVTWTPPEDHQVKCSTDGASRGNPGMSSIGFCIRDTRGDLIYALAKGIGIATNIEAETIAIFYGLRECKSRRFPNVIIETDSLSLKKIIQKAWRVPWELAEKVEEIREIMQQISATITHIFREGNGLADSLANIAMESQSEHQYLRFQEFPLKEKRILNVEKAQIPTLRIRTRKIIPQ
ncbi:hypothetical protein MTR67_042709 [Solanum verrucosum]|uniref:RNase H type-1 domain-containing protein n=1 Tax=Solanum verrucosum TaxID=315347 RepID=A0AAF0ZUE3_SOLVR|nr:hypothetical protein MTR67_042709 [Solanum verrucosum]